MPVIGVRPTTEMLARKKLTLDDVMRAPHPAPRGGSRRRLPARQVQFRVGDVSVKYNGKKVAGTILQGSTAQVGEVTDLTLLQGRLFTDEEDQRGAHVVVLGHDTWEELFGDQHAVGKEVNIETGLYTVIGVLDKRSSPSAAAKIPTTTWPIFPLGTFHNLHPEDKDMWVSVKYDDPKNKALVEEEIRELLRIRRKVKVDKPDDFEIFGPDSLSKLWGQLTGGLVLFMIAVSSVGLMVGGVGVMNIMLVSVTERTREIGVRKAIGATKRTLLDAVHHRGGHPVRRGRHHRHSSRRRAHVDHLLPAHRPACHDVHDVGDHRLRRLLRHRPDLRHLSRMEGRQSRPDRGVAIRVR